MLCFQTDDGDERISLNLDHAIWANSVIASGNAVGVVIYTGLETRSVMNTSQPASKVNVTPYLCLSVGLIVSRTVLMVITGFVSIYRLD